MDYLRFKAPTVTLSPLRISVTPTPPTPGPGDYKVNDSALKYNAPSAIMTLPKENAYDNGLGGPQYYSPKKDYVRSKSPCVIFSAPKEKKSMTPTPGGGDYQNSEAPSLKYRAPAYKFPMDGFFSTPKKPSPGPGEYPNPFLNMFGNGTVSANNSPNFKSAL